MDEREQQLKRPQPRHTERHRNDALKIGELPELHMVAVDELVFHEDPDMERVERLVERFSADGMLKNPPVVARTDEGDKRIVLDGANRLMALKKLGIPHVLVQIMDLYDEGLVLDCWHHAVEYLARDELLAHAASIPGVMMEQEDEYTTITPGYLCRMKFPDGDGILLKSSTELFKQVEQLHRFTQIYHRFDYLDRVSYTNLEHLRRNYRHFSALVSFRHFTREDLITLTEESRRVPSGITRVLLPKRALRFNLQLEILRSDLSLEEKDDWLQKTITQKVAEKSIRFYREPTFFFDE